MSTIGYGYGSEWHLLRYLGFHREALDQKVAKCVGCTSVSWRDYRFSRNDAFLDAELKGMEFLEAQSPTARAYTHFWPEKGNKPNWDAVAQVVIRGQKEWLLVEAKAHLTELKVSSGSQAQGRGRAKIASALQEAKTFFGVADELQWLESPYYQYANRLATLQFLMQHKEPARLLFIYFCGDAQPKKGRKNCPRTEKEWRPALKVMKSSLGLPSAHLLQDRVHELFLPVCPGGQTGAITQQSVYTTRRIKRPTKQ